MSAPAVKLSNIDNVPSERLLKLLFTEEIPGEMISGHFSIINIF